MDAGLERRLGWDAGWAEAFEPFAAAGLRPARVVAVHRETSIVRDGAGDRPAVVSGPRSGTLRLAPSDFPTVGDWVALDGDDVDRRVLPRRSAFRRMATDAAVAGRASTTSRSWPPNIDVALLVAGPRQRLQPAPDRALPRGRLVERVSPVVVLNKADLADDVDGRLVAVDAIAPGRARSSPSRPGPAPGSMSCAAISGRARPRPSWARPASASRPWSTRCSARTARRPAEVRDSDSRGRHTTTHRELFELPGGALLVDTPGIRSLEVLGADEGVDVAFDDVVDIAATCRFSDCRHDGEPGCAIRAALDDGRLTEERLASHRKLERESARAAREGDPRARAEHRRTWKIIHKSVNEHMNRKYGAER